MPSERAPGFYWVLRGGDWEPAEWDVELKSWRVLGLDVLIPDDDMAQVGERIEREVKP